MSTVRVVDMYPPLQFIDRRPKCDAKLSRGVAERNVFWRKKGTFDTVSSLLWRKDVADDECGHAARYRINGKAYCRKHAALVALDLIAEKVKP